MLNILPVGAQLPLPAGVPRGDVLVIREQNAPIPDPYQFNERVPGRVISVTMVSLAAYAYLWIANGTNGELVPWLAEGVNYSDDFTTCRIYTRKGAYWNDGVPFTAHDVVFTIQTSLNTPEWTTHSYAITWVESVTAENDATVLIKLKAPNPRFHYQFAAIIVSTDWWIVPKHIWEGQDPVNFKFYPPLSIGPYNLKVVDPGGMWTFWEREENWWAYKLWGLKPSPKYVLSISYGPEEKNALAMARHELDTAMLTTSEVAEIAIKGGSPYIVGFRDEPPYAWPYCYCAKSLTFNLLRYPFNITEVRKALTFACNMSNFVLGFTGFDGSKPTTSPLPVIRNPTAQKLYYEPLKEELAELGVDTNRWLWKYDPAEAERLLLEAGFSKDANGKWLLPSGETWKIRVLGVPEWADINRLAFLIAEEWKKFGIDAEAELVEGSIWMTRYNRGEFDVVPMWLGCSVLWDLTPHIQWWSSKYFMPEAPRNGWQAYQFPDREKLDAIIEEMEMTSTIDKDKLVELGRRALLIWAKWYVWPCYFEIPFYVGQDTYAWYGWPVYPDNWYQDPLPWCAQFLFILLRLYPTGRVPTKDALPMPGGTLPTTPTPSTEILEEINNMIRELSRSVSSVNDNVRQVSDSVSKLTEQVSGLTSQISMLITGIIIEAIIIVILAISLLIGRRKQQI
jgi:peptide/nickel transport system substrate-binding protein